MKYQYLGEPVPFLRSPLGANESSSIYGRVLHPFLPKGLSFHPENPKHKRLMHVNLLDAIQRRI